MRRLLFVLLASTVLAAPAKADWRLVSQHGFSKIYVDPASREKRPEGVVFVRALTDYDPDTAEAVDFKLSEKGLSEIENALFDCEKHAYRSEGGRWFEGRMASGAARRDYPAKASWSKIPSFYAPLAATACAAE